MPRIEAQRVLAAGTRNPIAGIMVEQREWQAGGRDERCEILMRGDADIIPRVAQSDAEGEVRLRIAAGATRKKRDGLGHQWIFSKTSE